MSGIACGVLMASGCGSLGMREKNKVVFLQGIYYTEKIYTKNIPKEQCNVGNQIRF